MHSTFSTNSYDSQKYRENYQEDKYSARNTGQRSYDRELDNRRKPSYYNEEPFPEKTARNKDMYNDNKQPSYSNSPSRPYTSQQYPNERPYPGERFDVERNDSPGGYDNRPYRDETVRRGDRPPSPRRSLDNSQSYNREKPDENRRHENRNKSPFEGYNKDERNYRSGSPFRGSQSSYYPTRETSPVNERQSHDSHYQRDRSPVGNYGRLSNRNEDYKYDTERPGYSYDKFRDENNRGSPYKRQRVDSQRNDPYRINEDDQVKPTYTRTESQNQNLKDESYNRSFVTDSSYTQQNPRAESSGANIQNSSDHGKMSYGSSVDLPPPGEPYKSETSRTDFTDSRSYDVMSNQRHENVRSNDRPYSFKTDLRRSPSPSVTSYRSDDRHLPVNRNMYPLEDRDVDLQSREKFQGSDQPSRALGPPSDRDYQAGTGGPPMSMDHFPKDMGHSQDNGPRYRDPSPPPRNLGQYPRDFCPPTDNFGPPPEDRGSLSRDFNTSPSRDFGAPSRVFHSPPRDLGQQSKDFGSQSRDLGPPSRDFETISRDIGPMTRDLGPPNRDFNPSRMYENPLQNDLGQPSRNTSYPARDAAPPFGGMSQRIRTPPPQERDLRFADVHRPPRVPSPERGNWRDGSPQSNIGPYGQDPGLRTNRPISPPPLGRGALYEPMSGPIDPGYQSSNFHPRQQDEPRSQKHQPPPSNFRPEFGNTGYRTPDQPGPSWSNVNMQRAPQMTQPPPAHPTVPPPRSAPVVPPPTARPNYESPPPGPMTGPPPEQRMNNPPPTMSQARGPNVPPPGDWQRCGPPPQGPMPGPMPPPQGPMPQGRPMGGPPGDFFPTWPSKTVSSATGTPKNQGWKAEVKKYNPRKSYLKDIVLIKPSGDKKEKQNKNVEAGQKNVTAQRDSTAAESKRKTQEKQEAKKTNVKKKEDTIKLTLNEQKEQKRQKNEATKKAKDVCGVAIEDY